jgi:glucose/arabinose dehydrogenase
MKKCVLWTTMIALIVLLIGCGQKQTDEKKDTTQETAVEVITSEEEINQEKVLDETSEDNTSKDDATNETNDVGNVEDTNNTEKLEDNSIEVFEVEKAKVLERIESMEFTPSNYELVEVFKESEFNQPLHLTYDYIGGQYTYIVEKQGLIKRIRTTNNAMEIFMDLTKVVDSSENEMGLLGMAFHPKFPEDPRFFLYYTEDNKAKIVSYEIIKSDGEKAYVVSAENMVEILEFSQPYVNHNGGHIAFGLDGYLYIASGDGGSKGDPDNNAQNLTNLLGKILRIDIDNRSDSNNYSIPEDNPFVNDFRQKEGDFCVWSEKPMEI